MPISFRPTIQLDARICKLATEIYAEYLVTQFSLTAPTMWRPCWRALAAIRNHLQCPNRSLAIRSHTMTLSRTAHRRRWVRVISTISTTSSCTRIRHRIRLPAMAMVECSHRRHRINSSCIWIPAMRRRQSRNSRRHCLRPIDKSHV